MKYLALITILFLTINLSTAQNFDFGKVSKDELQEKFHPTDSSVEAAVLYKNEFIHYQYISNEGFIQQREVHERIKIYNKEGLDWATKKVYLYYGSAGRSEKLINLKATTYNLENGKIVKTKLSKDGKFKEDYNEYTKISSFTMPNAKEGSVIEYRYRITSPFTGIDDVIFQYNIPINKFDLKISTPEYYIYNKQLNLSSSFMPRLSETRKNINTPFQYVENVVTANEENIPALRKEAFSGNLNNYRAKLALELTALLNNLKQVEKSFSSDWEDVTRTIYQSSNFGEQLKKSSFYKDELAAYLEGASTDRDKVTKTLEFIKSKVKWNGNYGKYAQKGVRKAYKESEGNVADINLLLVTMLRSLDLDANPVLVSTKDNGIPLFPTREGFNYVICMVKSEDGAMLIDGTEKYGSINVLPFRALNWQGRLIEKNGTSQWIELNSPSQSEATVMLNVKIDEDFGTTGTLKKNITSYLAMKYRQDHNDLSLEGKIKNHESDKEGIEIVEYSYQNEDDYLKPVRLAYDFELADAVDEIGEKLYFNPLFCFALKESPFKLEERQYPIDFVIPMKDKYTINIMIPEGYNIESLPNSEAFTFNNGQSNFKYIIKQSGRFLRLSFNFDINFPVINSADYKEFKNFYSKYIEKQSEQVVLSKAQP
ncbi:DUF3857 domain-containing protein [Winogradskyella poriferorum]|uniref:DUF3857 domain-containing protein n=1 Tax=Winogradskyella poriferorum TaxID=307627 RepID=UPI003D658EB1